MKHISMVMLLITILVAEPVFFPAVIAGPNSTSTTELIFADTNLSVGKNMSNTTVANGTMSEMALQPDDAAPAAQVTVHGKPGTDTGFLMNITAEAVHTVPANTTNNMVNATGENAWFSPPDTSIAAASVTADNGSTTAFDIHTYQLPGLFFDRSQDKVVIHEAVSPNIDQMATSRSTQTTGTLKDLPSLPVPAGAIIHHSKDGITTVFDKRGKQLFFADDAQTRMIPTPRGMSLASSIHEIPSGSSLFPLKNVIYTIYNNEIILVEINEPESKDGGTSSQPLVKNPPDSPGIRTSAAVKADDIPYPLYWVERVAAFMDPEKRLKNFSAEWTVPNPPKVTNPNQIQYLLIQEGAWHKEEWATIHFASVLEWNYYPQEWDITSWFYYYNESKPGYYSKRIVVQPGDPISGEITSFYGNPPIKYPLKDSAWNVKTRGPTGYVTQLNLIGPLDNWGAATECFLKLSGDNFVNSEDNFVGDTTFHNFRFMDEYDKPVFLDITYLYINSDLRGKPEYSHMRIESDNWPDEVVLRTSAPEVPEIPEILSYSMTNVELYRKSHDNLAVPALDYYPGTGIYGNISRILKDEGWQPAFYHNDTAVTKEDFGTRGGGLNNATFHYHFGHGNYSQALPFYEYRFETDGTVPKTVQPYLNYSIHYTELDKQWGKKNKWILIDACSVLENENWGRALKTSHGILGFASTKQPSQDLPNLFFTYALEDNSTIFNAYRNATYGSFTKNVTAAVIFDNQYQLEHDHFPGHGEVAPDEDPDDDYVMYPEPWNCGGGKIEN